MKINVIYFDAIGNYEKLLRKLEIRKSIIAEEEDCDEEEEEEEESLSLFKFPYSSSSVFFHNLHY